MISVKSFLKAVSHIIDFYLLDHWSLIFMIPKLASPQIPFLPVLNNTTERIFFSYLFHFDEFINSSNLINSQYRERKSVWMILQTCFMQKKSVQLKKKSVIVILELNNLLQPTHIPKWSFFPPQYSFLLKKVFGGNIKIHKQKRSLLKYFL